MAVKIKKGQIWKDKKTGDIMHIINRNRDVMWNCVFDRSTKSHKMSEFIIKKYYVLVTTFEH
jgi:hypothetical protein